MTHMSGNARIDDPRDSPADSGNATLFAGVGFPKLPCMTPCRKCSGTWQVKTAGVKGALMSTRISVLRPQSLQSEAEKEHCKFPPHGSHSCLIVFVLSTCFARGGKVIVTVQIKLGRLFYS